VTWISSRSNHPSRVVVLSAWVAQDRLETAVFVSVVRSQPNCRLRKRLVSRAVVHWNAVEYTGSEAVQSDVVTVQILSLGLGNGHNFFVNETRPNTACLPPLFLSLTGVSTKQPQNNRVLKARGTT
jgi:hypothetical protein